MKDNILYTKSIAFAIRCVNLYKHLTTEKKEFVLSKQLLRRGTSIGANVSESKNAQSKADFISKMSIALKESSETEYWLELLHESGYVADGPFESIYDDNCKISATLINIKKESQGIRRIMVIGYCITFIVKQWEEHLNIAKLRN